LPAFCCFIFRSRFRLDMAPKQPKSQAAEEPAEKKAKTEEAPKEVEEKFQEPDAPKDGRPAISAKVGFAASDTTLNVVPTVGGKLLTCLSEGGMSYLLAGARANVGQKAGRYMFEAKIVEQGQHKPTVRIGFSTAEAGLIVGADAFGFYFDNEGHFKADKQNKVMKGNCQFRKDQVVAVVLNLDSKSPNANTVALFRDGVACGDAMPLPESLKGKTLFPHITYRNASVRVNFGATALHELPFKCTMLQAAATADAAVAASKEPKDGKYEVMMPVAFPDEGTFEWLDGFLETNPSYVELSDRKIAQWAKASGHHSKGGGDRGSNDKPQLNTGISELDNMSLRKVINAVAPCIPRNYVIMEVKSNLIAAERQEALKKFNYPCYKKTARVIMGEPGKEWKAKVQNKLLKDKQAKSDKQFAQKKAEAERKKAAEKRQKEAAKVRKEAEKKRAAALAEKKKKEAEEKAAKEGGEKKEEEKKEESAPEKAESEDEKEEAPEAEMEAPTVELTDEEKKLTFLPNFKGTYDLDAKVMGSFFGKFSTPAGDEGFDDIKYEWQPEAKATAYLKEWVLNKKLTTRMDDIKPGKVFREKVVEFEKLCKQWKDKHAAFKAGGSKKPAKKADEDDDIDIFSVTDVCDVGGGVPLFDTFTFEDWELMRLRFQLCLLVLSFKVDCNDPDRAGIPMDHLAFYFNKYYAKNFSPKPFGVADTKEVINMVKDSVSTKDGLVVSQLSDDLDNLDIFLKLTEEGRRERQRRLDAGDETARLKFTQPAEPKPAAPKPAPKPATPAPKAQVAAPQKSAAVAAAVAAQKTPVVQASKGAGKAGGKGKGKW